MARTSDDFVPGIISSSDKDLVDRTAGESDLTDMAAGDSDYIKAVAGDRDLTDAAAGDSGRIEAADSERNQVPVEDDQHEVSGEEMSPSPGGQGPAPIAEVLRYLLKLIYVLGFGSVLGTIHEGRVYRRLKGTQVARAFEQSALDSAVFLGMKALSDMGYADKLDYIGSISQKELHDALLYQDGKAMAWQLSHPTGKTRLLYAMSTAMTDAQHRHAALLHISLVDRPGAVAIVPVPKTRYLRFFDSLGLQMGVPGRIAPFVVSLEQVEDVYKWLPGFALTGQPVHMPGTAVDMSQWRPKLGGNVDLLKAGGEQGKAATRAFDLLRAGLKASVHATKDGVSLDLHDYQPLGGDAMLNEWLIELKELATETADGTVMIGQLYAFMGGAYEDIMRSCVFNPWRLWEFACFLDPAGAFLYFLPCSVVRKEWWSDKKHIEIDQASIDKFRVALDHDDWFDDIYEIVMSNPSPQRPSHIIPARFDPNLYAAANYGVFLANEEDDSDEVLPTAPPADGRTRRGAHLAIPDQIMRANDECARRGRGVFLSLGRERARASYIFVDRIWSNEDKTISRHNPGYVPITPTTLDISPYMPLLAIETLSCHYTRFPTTQHPCMPVNVSGSLLVRSDRSLLYGFPCLWLIDCFGYEERQTRHSVLLIPSEFIDEDKILETWSKRFDKKIRSREDFDAASRAEGLSDAARRIAATIDLQRFIKHGLSLQEFMVRPGKQMLDGIFMLIGRHGYDRKKWIQWYEDGLPICGSPGKVDEDDDDDDEGADEEESDAEESDEPVRRARAGAKAKGKAKGRAKGKTKVKARTGPVGRAGGAGAKAKGNAKARTDSDSDEEQDGDDRAWDDAGADEDEIDD
ncbi:hypothetical protein LTR36_010906 [Oleoguttula mirabilis]|uniref:Uncharacterized protein n=1 Tax=Oleoguttula mirabilis TaxID=1507867 RepID=A0AAV9J3U9_9PEZI|nr:hypothetical protein LTR36_010906 [Oleoguttula mirabilis]